jgi:hypothetical protein
MENIKRLPAMNVTRLERACLSVGKLQLLNLSIIMRPDEAKVASHAMTASALLEETISPPVGVATQDQRGVFEDLF